MNYWDQVFQTLSTVFTLSVAVWGVFVAFALAFGCTLKS